VAPEQMTGIRDKWAAVAAFFDGLGFVAVELDPAGYHRGGLLVLAPRPTA
jgi:hypothetical protein